VLPIECALHIIYIEIGCFAGRRGRGQVCPAAHGGLWNQGRFSQGPRGVVECVLYSLCSLSLALLHKGLDVHRGVVTHTQMHTHARTLDSLSLSFSLSLSLSLGRERALSLSLYTFDPTAASSYTNPGRARGIRHGNRHKPSWCSSGWRKTRTRG
jgi:hypothetical protein